MTVTYKGIGPERGQRVPAENALPYAMERCGIQFTSKPGDTSEEFKEMLVEWFFSGNWIRKEAEGDETAHTRRMAG